MSRRILIAGCGYVGACLADLLVADGNRVWGLKRTPANLPDGVTPVAGDVNDPATLSELPEVDAVVYAVSPGGRTEEAYRSAYVTGLGNVLNAMGGSPRVILVSSTGVYGHSDGRWVDEDTPEEPADGMARSILEGEALARRRGAPGVVLRLGGIYGPGRTRTVDRVVSGSAPCMAPDLYGNRIHRDDAAGALRHLLTLEDPEEVYLGVDREPASLRETYGWIAREAGVADPCEGVGPGEERSSGRRGTNKRCSSERLAASGYPFRFPTYREGYGEILSD